MVASKLGSTLITINENSSSNQINSQLKLTRPELIICDDEKKLKNLKYGKKKIQKKEINKFKKNLNLKNKKKINLNYNYIITFSSGTTSDPKAVVFSQQIKYLRFKHIKKLYRLNKKDNIFSVSPLDHSLGQRLFFSGVKWYKFCI